MGLVLVRGGCLHSNCHGTEKYTGANAWDKIDEDPGWSGSIHLQQEHQAHAQCRNSPPTPCELCVLPSDGDHNTSDHTGWSNGESLREERDTSKDQETTLGM